MGSASRASLEWLLLGTSDQLSGHRRDSVCELLRSGDFIERCEWFNFDVQSYDELLGFSSAIWCAALALPLADLLSDVERDTAGRPLHLAAEVHFPAGELGYDTAYAAIEFERAAVDIEPMEVVSTGAALA